MINVCCVFYGNKYSSDYVQYLYNMIQRHLTIPHQFYCFTDHKNLFDTVYGNIIYKDLPLTGYKGWWNKLQLFNPEIGLEGVNLYFDLDIVITKNIDCFATWGDDKSFSILTDFEPKLKEYNSSIMKWNNDTASIIWKEYIDKYFSILHLNHSDERAKILWQQYGKQTRFFSDQEVISKVMYNRPELKLFPDEWTFSAKWYDRNNPRFDKSKQTFEEKIDSKIAVFHGKPDPHELSQKWIIDNWK